MDGIKDILELTFPGKIGAGGSAVGNSCPVQILSGEFSLSDPDACDSCVGKHPGVVSCSKEILKFKSCSTVHVLEFDKYVKSFNRNFHQCCDYIAYDTSEDKSKIAFCELTCSNTEHVEPYSSADGKNNIGKRAKAFGQIRDTLETLLTLNVLDQNILTYPSKIGIFGWRERKANDGYEDAAVESMAEFSDTPSSEEPVLYTKDFILQHDFIFIQVKYPYVFQWNQILNN